MAPNTPNSTNTLQRTITVAQNFVRNAPLTFSGTGDPALIIGDWVRQFMLGPPFAWRWNRNKATQTLTAGTQDYVLAVPTFGWLEKAVVTDTTVSPNLSYELEIDLALAPESTTNLPTKISPLYDDGNGNITFRLFPVPDKNYTLNLIFQNSPPIFRNLNDTWAPVPDYLSYLYLQGYLAKSYEYLADPRFAIAVQLFLRQVISANAGLDQTQVNIFLAERLNSTREQQDTLTKSQQGHAGRGMYG